MLEVISLWVTAGNFRLQDVNLSVARGECHAVLGPSGSGKSTLLNTILGVQSVESGRIYLDGTEVTHWPIEKRGLGYVPQELGLFPHLTVRDNLAYSARARGIPPREFQPPLDQLVEVTALRSLLDRWPHTLSGGERQRVGLVRALASRPRLVLLDEPFTALNTSLRRELWFWLGKLQREVELTILLVTHDLHEAYVLADRITVLMQGRVLQQGAKAEVYARPAVAEVAQFLGVENLQPGRIEGTQDGRVSVRVGSVRLIASAPAVVTAEVLVSIRAEDVALSPGRPRGENVQNCLPARVVAIRPGNALTSVEMDVGFPLQALITRSACEEWQLGPGTEVSALIKASSIHLIPQNR